MKKLLYAVLLAAMLGMTACDDDGPGDVDGDGSPNTEQDWTMWCTQNPGQCGGGSVCCRDIDDADPQE